MCFGAKKFMHRCRRRNLGFNPFKLISAEIQLSDLFAGLGALILRNEDENFVRCASESMEAEGMNACALKVIFKLDSI